MHAIVILILLVFSGFTLSAIAQQRDVVAVLLEVAKEQTLHEVTYDGAYLSIPYPNGDVPDNIGVCSDVIIRAYRKVGIDLQKEVHEDMRANFSLYPSKRIWGLSKPDKNIDHRRVPNLQVFFSRFGESLAVRQRASDYLPGDIVSWMLPGNLPHIGFVIDDKSGDGARPMITGFYSTGNSSCIS